MAFVEYSSELKNKSFSLRREVRSFALETLSWWHTEVRKPDALFSRNRIQFLYIHHVFKDEEEALKRLMTALAKSHSFISYSDAVHKILTGKIDKPYICISSDDGLKNNLRAAEILNEFDAKACFFICPSIIGVNNISRIAAFSENRLHFPPVEFLSWEEVALLQKWGHEIGGHTMSHVNLAVTPIHEMQSEIVECFKILQQRCGSVSHFAYPYGRYHHFNPESRKLSFEAGFTSFASAERGCHVVQPGHTMQAEELLIRRDHVILSWPLKHILYFLAANAQKATVKNNYFP